MAAQGLLVPGITDLAPGFGCRELLKVSVLYAMIMQSRDSSTVSTSTPGVGTAHDKIDMMAMISASNVSGHRSMKCKFWRKWAALLKHHCPADQHCKIVLQDGVETTEDSNIDHCGMSLPFLLFYYLVTHFLLGCAPICIFLVLSFSPVKSTILSPIRSFSTPVCPLSLLHLHNTMDPPPYHDTRAAHRIIVPITSDHYLPSAFPDNDKVHCINIIELSCRL